MANIWGHLKTITKHKIAVTKLCFRCGLYKQGLLHDLSKYSWVEFSAGARYYQGNRSPSNKRYIKLNIPRDHSSAGRAPALQAGGHRFEPCWSHDS